MKLDNILKRLVGVETPTGKEDAIVPLVDELMKSVGLKVTIQPVDGKRSNIIGRLGIGEKLVFCSHLDTVSIGPEHSWQHPPLSGEVEDGFMYGRGTCDAKGQLAAILGAIEMLAREPPCEIIVAAVVEEETGRSLGARKFLETEIPDAAVVCEPTDLVICTAHKGSIRPEITVYGRSAHASNPRSGDNAIYKMVDAIKSLERYGLSIAGRYEPILGNPSLTITMIDGGEQPNMIPQKCSIVVDRRLVSNETTGGAMKELYKKLETIAEENELAVEVKLISQYPPTSTPREDPLVVSCCKAQQEVLGKVDVGAFKGGCDMWSFREKNVPTVIIGPGKLEDTHCVDERISLVELETGAKVFNAIARNWADTHIKD